MTRHVPPTAFETGATSAMVIDAMRCWRAARDEGRPCQPCLTRVLAAYDCAILAPVLDSLISFYAAELGRPMSTGTPAALSEDERSLLGLLDGSARRTCGPRSRNGGALDCAVCSTRIMLTLALADRSPQGSPR